MKSQLLAVIFVMLLTFLLAEPAVQVDPELVNRIALSQAEILWGKVYEDEPIALFDQNGTLIAWQYNFCKGKPFPEREALLNRIRQTGNNLWGVKWSGEEFANLVIGARTDRPVIIGYGNGLSYEYSHSETIRGLAEASMGKGYQVKSHRLNGLGSRWTEVSDGNRTLFIKAYPPALTLSKEEYLAYLKSDLYPEKPVQDYSEEWASFLSGGRQSREWVMISSVEKMPFIAYSYGCSATSGAMLAGYYDNKSSSPTQNYATFSGVHYKRYDAVSEALRYHVPSSLTEIAVFMDTDSVTYGMTWPNDMPSGMGSFFSSKGHTSWNCLNAWHWEYEWSNHQMMVDLWNEIEWNSPTLMNTYNHTVVGIGHVADTYTVILQDPNNYEHVFWHISDFWYLAKIHPRPKTGCTVNIISPDGGGGWHDEGQGQTFQAGSVMDISWQTDNVPGSWVKIFYTSNPTYGQTSWTPITSVAPNTGYFGWIIPSGLSGSDFRLKIQVFDSQNYLVGVDGSHGSFTINSGGSITELLNDVAVVVPASQHYYRFNSSSSAWAVAGMRKPASINNLGKLTLSNSSFTAQYANTQSYGNVCWVALDRNHLSGTQYGLKAELIPHTSQNKIEFEGGNQTLSMGQNTGINWIAEDVVKIWNVTLSAGTYSFVLNFPGAAGDLGFALVSSHNGVYYATGANPLNYSDSDNVPGYESFSVTVPGTDVYGLLVWSNSNYAGTINISIGYNSIWTGLVDTNWNLADNWSSGSIPTSIMDVLIPAKPTGNSLCYRVKWQIADH